MKRKWVNLPLYHDIDKEPSKLKEMIDRQVKEVSIYKDNLKIPEKN